MGTDTLGAARRAGFLCLPGDAETEAGFAMNMLNPRWKISGHAPTAELWALAASEPSAFSPWTSTQRVERAKIWEVSANHPPSKCPNRDPALHPSFPATLPSSAPPAASPGEESPGAQCGWGWGGTSRHVGQDETDPPCPAPPASFLRGAASRGVSVRFEAPSGKRQLEGAPSREEMKAEGEEMSREHPLGAAIPRSRNGDKAQAGQVSPEPAATQRPPEPPSPDLGWTEMKPPAGTRAPGQVSRQCTLLSGRCCWSCPRPSEHQSPPQHGGDMQMGHRHPKSLTLQQNLG